MACDKTPVKECMACWIFRRWRDEGNTTWIKKQSVTSTLECSHPQSLPDSPQTLPIVLLMITHCPDSYQQRVASPVYIISTNGTIQSELFRVWLLSLTIKFVRFIFMVDCNVERFSDACFKYKKKIWKWSMFFIKLNVFKINDCCFIWDYVLPSFWGQKSSFFGEIFC